MQKVFGITGLLILVVSTLLLPTEIGFIDGEQFKNVQLGAEAIDYVDRNAIAVMGNTDFLLQAATEGWIGTGTKEDPIIIEGFRIEGSKHLFRMVNTDLHFIFRNSILNGIDKAWCGLYLANMSNGVITNVVVKNSATAFHTVAIANCTISQNEIYDSKNEAIALELPCSGNIISENLIHDNLGGGIWFDYGCKDNIISRNQIYDNGGNGIYIWQNTQELWISGNVVVENNITRQVNGISIQSTGNLIKNNTITDSHSAGILCKGYENTFENNIITNTRGIGIQMYLYGTGNVFSFNSIQNSTEYGMRIRTLCNDNIVTNNDFINNNLTSQVSDDGDGNIFSHNYFSSWNAPDTDANGEVDIGYPISGVSNNTDQQPLTYPNCELPDWYEHSIVSATIVDDWQIEQVNIIIALSLMLVVTVGVVLFLSRKRS
ncbi:MAG: nitrous oxide reductase family maturation protein NosD [Candidatus Thorarchaeota archaeon]